MRKEKMRIYYKITVDGVPGYEGGRILAKCEARSRREALRRFRITEEQAALVDAIPASRVPDNVEDTKHLFRASGLAADQKGVTMRLHDSHNEMLADIKRDCLAAVHHAAQLLEGEAHDAEHALQTLKLIQRATIAAHESTFIIIAALNRRRAP
jgi:hypothetical protein